MVIFTANKYSRDISKVELIGLDMRHQWVADYATAAKMPRTPGRWTFGWADLLECKEGTARPIARMKIGVDGLPITRRHYGLIRWHA